jgi:Ser/Thr protein kinase RdoA (MazF antagonist)
MVSPAPVPASALLADVLHHYGLRDARCSPLTLGHINATWRVDASTGGPYVLQRLHPIFVPELQHDFVAISEHLRAAGLVAPRLVPTLQQARWVLMPAAPGGGPPAIWRLQTFVAGVVHDRAESPEVCAAAGAQLGRTHRALRSFVAPLQAARHVHDTPAQLRALGEASQASPSHPADAQIRPVAAAILQAAADLPDLRGLPKWVVHGDPKINNFLFAPTGPTRAIAMVDFDTFNRLPVCMELGDALRSWCNPYAEDDPRSELDLQALEAALEGYGAGLEGALLPAEVQSLGFATEVLAVELAARFARDAFEETYFGWDRQRFAASWEHQLARATGQLALATSHRRQRAGVQQRLARVF